MNPNKFILSGLILFISLSIYAQQPADSLYKYVILNINSSDKAPAQYGLSAEMPVTVGAFKFFLSDRERMLITMNRFYKTFTWPDGSPINFSSRYSINVKNIPIDVYSIVARGSKDTIKLYASMYDDSPVFIPSGLRQYTKEQFTAELKPILENIKQLFNSKDWFGDGPSKEETAKLLAYVQKNIGLAYFLDREFMAPVMNDTVADQNLRGFLWRSYIFHKLYNEGVNAPLPLVNAYNSVLDDMNSTLKLHPELKTGSLLTLQRKKVTPVK
jgi:hypothetical protein